MIGVLGMEGMGRDEGGGGGGYRELWCPFGGTGKYKRE